MKKRIIPFVILPLFLFGCGKNKNVYASSKNTIYEFTLNGDDAIITGLNKNYKNQTDIIITYSIDKHVVKRIENHSFEGIYRLKNIDMSKSKLEEIGASSFKKCTNLTNIIYSDTITNIEENAFEECTSLTTMDLSKCKIDVVSDNLFSKCSSLTGVTFPSTIKKIGSNIYSGCDNITAIDFSNYSIEEIGEKAFYNLTNLKDVTLPLSTKKIGDYAFADNAKIQFLNFASTQIEEIGDGSFSNCKLLANIILPTSLKKLGNEAFYYCSKLEKINLSKTRIEEIPESCFELCGSLDTIQLSEVKKIGSRAFYNSALRLIDIPKETFEISDDAFGLCKKLEELTVDSSNTSYIIQNNALYTINKEKLIVYPAANSNKIFVISDNTSVINSYAFANAVNLEEVDLRSVKIEEIKPYTFMNCVSLKSILMGDDASTGIKKIGTKAFFGCKELTKFDGEYSITEIGDSAFYDCINLKELYLGESTFLLKIDSEAFYNCNKLEILTLPGSLGIKDGIIGRAAFYGCVNITSISFGANKTYLDQLFERIRNTGYECGLESFKDIIICG